MIFDEITDSEKLLCELQHSPNGMTLTEIRNFFSRHKRRKETHLMLRAMMKADSIRVEVTKTNGRPTTRVFAK